MNGFYNRASVELIKAEFPEGTRIVVLHMDEKMHPIPDGTRGTVKYVDDAGQIHLKYDNGRCGLALVPEVDQFRKLTPEELGKEGSAES